MGGDGFGILQFLALGHLLPVFSLYLLHLFHLFSFWIFWGFCDFCSYFLFYAHWGFIVIFSLFFPFNLLSVLSLFLWPSPQRCFTFRWRWLTEFYTWFRPCICLFGMCISAMMFSFFGRPPFWIFGRLWRRPLSLDLWFPSSASPFFPCFLASRWCFNCYFFNILSATDTGSIFLFYLPLYFFRFLAFPAHLPGFMQCCQRAFSELGFKRFIAYLL